MKKHQMRTGLCNDENATTRAKGRTLAHTESLIEHLEDELEPITFDEDLELLLKNSDSDRALFESLKQTRKLVKDADDVVLPESGLYYENLHAKIMAAIEEDDASQIRNGQSTRGMKRTRQSIAWTQVFGAIGMTMMLAIVGLMTLKTSNHNHQTTTPQEVAAAAEVQEAAADVQFERRLAMVDPRMGAQVAHELGGFESEEDFLTETAAARLKQISAGQASEMLYDLGR